MKASSVSDLLYQQLNFRAEKQKVIADNIANINTPNYKTKDMSFENVLQRTQKNNDLQLKITNTKHISSFQSNTPKSRVNIFEVKGLEEQNDGNNVKLDVQIGEMSKNSILFDGIKKSVKKDLAWFKEMIVASGKN
jgi:flagellar basal-body rod protein FlgB